jgi:hypothetical protein
MKKIILLLLLVTLSPVILWCGTTGKVAGKIVDAKTGEPLIGANIVILNTSLGGTTDIEGQYFVINIPPGKYDVKVSYIGYRSEIVKEVVINVDRTTYMDFQLQSEELQTDVIEIVANKTGIVKDLTSTSEQITAEQIQALPVESVGELLELQAGMTRDAGGVHLRGGRGNEVEYVVDGISVTSAWGGGLGVAVQTNAIQQMEVISGTFNAEYGRAMSGVVNIVTKDGSFNEYQGNITAYTGGYYTSHTDKFLNLQTIRPADQKFLEGSFSGPVPFIKNLSFFGSTRVTDVTGHLYGQRLHNISDTTNFSDEVDPSQWVQSTGDGSLVAMNWSESHAFQGKITYAPVQSLRFSYNLQTDYSKWQNYDHGHKYLPDYRPTYKSWGYNNTASLMHTISNSTFHELRGSYYTSHYKYSRYDDPYDPRYALGINDDHSTPSGVFAVGGVYSGFYKQNSSTGAVKYDFTSQVNNEHLIKFGAEYRQYVVEDEWFTVRRDASTNWELLVDDLSTTNHNHYKKKPFDFSAYAQDKIEIEDFIVNLGLRFDYFEPNSYMPADYANPHNDVATDGSQKTFDQAYVKVNPKMQVSPRLGFAFPVSDVGTLHASFGMFFQRPDLAQLYENPEFEVLGNFSSFIGNADLGAQQTTIYEIGIQQQIIPQLVADATVYYKDIRSLTSSKYYTTFKQATYGIYNNFDYGTIWGFTLTLDVFNMGMISSNIDYTYQVAEGNSSDPKTIFNDAGSSTESTKSLIPLSWDQRNVFNWTLTVHGDSWGVSSIARIASGWPATTTPSHINGSTPQLRYQSRVKPRYSLDMKLYKDFTYAGMDLTVFMNIENVLDQTSTENVPGISSDDLKSFEKYEFLNTLYENRYDPSGEPTPRVIKLGLSLSF